jgi:hypothetical protein
VDSHGTNITQELLLGGAAKQVPGESRFDVLVGGDKRAPMNAGAR